jgi:hypothetical protein
MDIKEVIEKNIYPSELNHTVSSSYVNNFFGTISTGCTKTIYDVSVYSLTEMYKWTVGKYISCEIVFRTLIELGYRLVQGLPARVTGVYAQWDKKPMELMFL